MRGCWLGNWGPLHKVETDAVPAVELAARLRYRLAKPRKRQTFAVPPLFPWAVRSLPAILRAPMSSTFDKVADIIAETCDIPRDTITPDSHAIDDLKIDSLDFLDIAFAIDKAFGIKLPLEQWTQQINDGQATTDQYFVLKNLCARIDELIAAKSAA